MKTPLRFARLVEKGAEKCGSFAGGIGRLQARAQPLGQGGELVNHIQLKQTLVGLQRTLWERLQQRAAAAAQTGSDAAAAAALTAAAESLRTDLKSLEELYNVYAQVRAKPQPNPALSPS